MHRYRYYRASKAATVFWWIRTIFVLSGIGNVTGRHPLLGLGTIIIGLLLEILAEDDVEKTLLQNWKKDLNEERIRANVFEAVRAYNQNPCRQSLNYIRTLNPEAANYIRRNAGKKQK